MIITIYKGMNVQELNKKTNAELKQMIIDAGIKWVVRDNRNKSKMINVLLGNTEYVNKNSLRKGKKQVRRELYEKAKEFGYDKALTSQSKEFLEKWVKKHAFKFIQVFDAAFTRYVQPFKAGVSFERADWLAKHNKSIPMLEYDTFKQRLKTALIPMVKLGLKKGSIKVFLVLDIVGVTPKISEQEAYDNEHNFVGIEDYKPKFFNKIELSKISSKKSFVIHNLGDLNTFLDEFAATIKKVNGKQYYYMCGVENLTFNTSEFKPIQGSSYEPLPVIIANKKAVVNIQNDDDKCFLYSVLCGLETLKASKPIKNSTRVAMWKRKLNELNIVESDSPMCLIDGNSSALTKFERRNNISVNIYTCNDNGSITIMYVNPSPIKERHCNLLFYKNHYSCITNMDRLLNSDGCRNYHCNSCLSKFSRAEIRDRHSNDCKGSGFKTQQIVMPKCDDNGVAPVIKFRGMSKQQKHPIVIYADCEAKLENNGETKENTTKIHTHKPYTFRLFIKTDLNLSGERSFVFEGGDACEKFIGFLFGMEMVFESLLLEALDKNRNIDKRVKFSNSVSCPNCEQKYGSKHTSKKSGNVSSIYQVRHHCHVTGKYLGDLCNLCNFKILEKIYKKCTIPVYFHNLNYDLCGLIREVYKFDEGKSKIRCIPETCEKFKTLTLGKYQFLDTMAFMNCSLGTLLENLPNDKKVEMKANIDYPEGQFDLIASKGFFPYEYFDHEDKLNLPPPGREAYYSRLSGKGLTDNDWEALKKVQRVFSIKTLREQYDLYLKQDVFGLCDVFENFRTECMNNYGLDPAWYISLPSYGWDAMLKMTGVELEQLTDVDMYTFCEKAKRGGLSVMNTRYAKANNMFMGEDYNPDEKSNFLMYTDANNLYGFAMVQPLPYANFEWCDDLTVDDIENYDENSGVGYIVECDLHYPENLHDLHNDFPLAPQKMLVGKDEKLCATLNDKENYKVEIRTLKTYMRLGLVLTKIHRSLKFSQKAWLKPFIDFNTTKRSAAKNNFEKDLFKLCNNSVFGKTMENVRDRIEVKFADNRESYIKQIARNSVVSFRPIHEDLMMVVNNTAKVKLDKPIYTGVCILDLSKLHMYSSWYDEMKMWYGDKVSMMGMDTDSFMYQVETENVYEDMLNHREFFDLTSMPEKYQDKTNNKVLGKFKDELEGQIMTEFVGLRAKVYSFKKRDGNVTKKLKGICKNGLDQINFNNYKECAISNVTKTVPCIGIRRFNQINYTISQNKKALENLNDKRIMDTESLHSFAIGHYKTR